MFGCQSDESAFKKGSDDFNGDYKDTAARKLCDDKITSGFLGEIQAMTDDDPCKSIWTLPRNLGCTDFYHKP